jgi:hypothetical protein
MKQNTTAISYTGKLQAVLVAAFVLVSVVPAVAQAGGEMQQKLAAVKASVAENQQKLHAYQWMETQQLTLNGDAKPPTQSMCMYGPSGTVQKSPMGPPPAPPSGGRLKQRIIEKKTDEMKQYMAQVKTLLGQYVPPDPAKMQAAFAAGKVSLNPEPGAGIAVIVFRDYSLPGDQMTITFNMGTKKVTGVNVNTYMDNPQDAVILTVQFASLPDGTNYVQQSVLNATAKKLVVTTTNGNYQRFGQ